MMLEYAEPIYIEYALKNSTEPITKIRNLMDVIDDLQGKTVTLTPDELPTAVISQPQLLMTRPEGEQMEGRTALALPRYITIEHNSYLQTFVAFLLL